MDFANIALLAVLAVLVFFMFRNNRKRKAQQEELRAKIVPGVEIMTNFGLFGTLVSVDEESNVAEVETSPGNIVRVHRQTISKVVEEAEEGDESAPRSVEEAMERANREQAEREATLDVDGNPAFGERIDPADPTKPRSKKDDE